MGKSGWRKLQCEFSAHFLSADWSSWRSGRSQCTLSIHRGSQCRAASVLSAHTLAYRALTSPCRQAPSCWRPPSCKRVRVWVCLFGFFSSQFWKPQAFTIPKEKKIAGWILTPLAKQITVTYIQKCLKQYSGMLKCSPFSLFPPGPVTAQELLWAKATSASSTKEILQPKDCSSGKICLLNSSQFCMLCQWRKQDKNRKQEKKRLTPQCCGIEMPQHQQSGATDLSMPRKGLRHRCSSSLC